MKKRPDGGEEFLDAVGREWAALPPIPHLRAQKFLERERTLRSAFNLAWEHLSEYLRKPTGLSAVDFSCGNGAFLEALRHHGLDVLGVDVQYFEFLDSQGVPYIHHDCRILPYPLEDRSQDIVTCHGAITFYRGTDWTDVLDEFGRIARRCIVITPNSGEVLDENRHKLNDWCPSEWKRVTSGPTWWKWRAR